jgi:hypothetical protein
LIVPKSEASEAVSEALVLFESFAHLLAHPLVVVLHFLVEVITKERIVFKHVTAVKHVLLLLPNVTSGLSGLFSLV